jgi:hypothetical protein
MTSPACSRSAPGRFLVASDTMESCTLDLLPDLTVSALLQAMAALSGPESPVGGVSIVLALDRRRRRGCGVRQHTHGRPCTRPVRARRVASGINAWVYQHDRDLTGFVDGTENPSALQAPGVAIAPDGTSVVPVQQWRHLPSWETLAVAEQELVIGRTKDDSTELADDVMPADSHVSRTVVEQDGEDLETSWRPDQPTVPEVCGLQHSVGLTAGSSDAGAAHQASTECRARSRAMRRGTTERLATEARGVPTARRSCRRSAGRPTACWRRA